MLARVSFVARPLHAHKAARGPAARPLGTVGLAPQQQLYAQREGSSSARMLQKRDLSCRATDGDSVDGDAEDTIELEIRVQGMTCGGCSTRVADALKTQSKVKAVQVDLDSKLASVEVQAVSLMDAVDMLPGFVQCIKELGFEAEPHIEYLS